MRRRISQVRVYRLLDYVMFLLLVLSFSTGWIAVYLGLNEFGIHKYSSIALVVTLIIHGWLHRKAWLKRKKRILPR
jgi:hypothetical protein